MHSAQSCHVMTKISLRCILARAAMSGMGPASAHDVMTTAEQSSCRNGGQLQLMTACGVALTRIAGKSPRRAGDWGPLLEGPGMMSVAWVAA